MASPFIRINTSQTSWGTLIAPSGTSFSPFPSAGTISPAIGYGEGGYGVNGYGGQPASSPISQNTAWTLEITK